MNSGVERVQDFHKELVWLERSAVMAHERIDRRSTAMGTQDKRIVQLEDTVRMMSADRARDNLKVWSFSVCFALLKTTI